MTLVNGVDPNEDTLGEAIYGKEKWKEMTADRKAALKEIERESNTRKRIEHEVTNRYFITLATLSAASITLLIQHLVSDSKTYSQIGLHFIKSSLFLFSVSLMLSVVHNFFKAKFDLNEREFKVVDFASWGAITAYVLGLCVLVLTVVFSI